MGAVAERNPGRYLEDDVYNFPVCFSCIQWTPFLIYLEDNPAAKKYRPLKDGMQLYCPMCAPLPDHFRTRFPGERIYRDESILNDAKLMALLAEFVYEHPRKEGFAQLDRIIITERTKLLEPYKKLAKKPLPKVRKMEQLMKLFPDWHRLANDDFGSFRAMRSAVRRKVAHIEDRYMNLSGAEHSGMHDYIDNMVDRTPMHARLISQQQQRQQRALMPPPPIREAAAAPLDAVAEEPSATNLTVSSLGDDISLSSESGATVSGDPLRMDSASDDDIVISQETLASQRRHPNASEVQVASQSGVHSSLSFQLSSQDVSGPSGAGAVIPDSPRRGFGIRSTVSSDSSQSSLGSTPGLASPPTTRGAVGGRRKRSLEESNSEDDEAAAAAASLPISMASPPTPNDGQVAGPSSKRQRSTTPVNPTPADFVRNPGARMPRLKGA